MNAATTEFPRSSTTVPQAAALVLTVAACVAATSLAVVAHVDGAPLVVVALAPAAVGVALLAAVSVARFSAFVLALLALRAGMDATVLLPTGLPVEPTAIVGVAFLVVGIIWVAVNRRTAAPHSLTPVLVALLAACALSVLGSADRLTSTVELTRIAAAVLMYVVLERLLVRGLRSTTLLLAIAASAVVPLLAAGWQAWTGQGLEVNAGFARLSGSFTHPNPFATYLVFLVLAGVALVPHLDRHRAWVAVGVAACTATLVGTYTRGAWVALVVGLAVVGVFQSRRTIAIFAIVLAALAIAVPSVAGRFADLDDPVAISGATGNSLTWRFQYWQETAELADENPITGLGLKMIQRSTSEGLAAHSDPLRMYVETGLLGITAYVLFIFALILHAWRALRRSSPGWERGVAVGFAACVAAFCVYSLAGNVISQVVVLWYFLALAAAAAGIGVDARRSFERAEPQPGGP